MNRLLSVAALVGVFERKFSQPTECEVSDGSAQHDRNYQPKVA